MAGSVPAMLLFVASAIGNVRIDGQRLATK